MRVLGEALAGWLAVNVLFVAARLRAAQRRQRVGRPASLPIEFPCGPTEHGRVARFERRPRRPSADEAPAQRSVR